MNRSKKINSKIGRSPSVIARNWIFFKPTPLRPNCSCNSTKTSKTLIPPFYSHSSLQPQYQPTEHIFMNTSISFTRDEKQIMDRADYSNNGKENEANIPLSYGGESRLDIAKSEHRMSQINLLQKQIKEEEEEKVKQLTKKYKYLANDESDNEILSQREDFLGLLHLEDDYNQDENNPSFVTENEKDPYLVKGNSNFKNTVKDNIYKVIQEKAAPPPMTIHTWNSCDGFNAVPNMHNSIQRLVNEMGDHSEYSVLPTLKNLPNPLDQNTFAIRKMQKEYNL